MRAGILCCRIARVRQLRLQHVRPCALGPGHLQRIAEEHRSGRHVAVPLQPLRLGQQTRQEIGIDRQRLFNRLRLTGIVAILAPRLRQRQQHERIARRCVVRFLDQRDGVAELAALHRVNAETKRGFRIARIAAAHIRPQLLGKRPLAAVRCGFGFPDDLGNVLSHARTVRSATCSINRILHKVAAAPRGSRRQVEWRVQSSRTSSSRQP
jgi:hypothetical protein